MDRRLTVLWSSVMQNSFALCQDKAQDMQLFRLSTLFFGHAVAE